MHEVEGLITARATFFTITNLLRSDDLVRLTPQLDRNQLYTVPDDLVRLMPIVWYEYMLS